MIDSPFVVLIDQRERRGPPYDFAGLRTDACQKRQPLRVLTRVTHLKTGDYTIDGLQDRVCVERKGGENGTADLFNTIGQSRKRFTRQLERMAAMEFSAIVIEADWLSILDAWPPVLTSLREYLRTRLRDTFDRPELRVIDPAKNMQRPSYNEWLNALDAVMSGPPARSHLPPKNVYRTILAWMTRYPTVHWIPCPGRRLAEVTTYRLLEKYWQQQQLKAMTATTGAAQR